MSGEPNLRVFKFDMSKMKENCVVVILGKRNTGKSTLMRDILYHFRSIPFGTVLSGTEEANEFYSSMMPSCQIKHEYSSDLIPKMRRRQLETLQKVKKKKDLDPRAFLVFDDVGFDKSVWNKDKGIKWIFMNGRHSKIMFLLTMQYPLGITPDLRSNVDYTFILRENNQRNRKLIFDHYAGIFKTFDLFNQTMDMLTANYGCMVIDNTKLDNKLHESMFWYKARTDHPPFTLCHPKLWELDAEYVKGKKEEEDMQNLAQLKRSPRVFIEKLLTAPP